MAQGPEDKHDWPIKQGYSIMVCTQCKAKILVHHCEKSGCPWCKNCRGIK